MQSDVKTFRGRTLEELLPRIREELGPDAIVLRRREGLAGGIGGFFQRSFVEVDARRGQPGELPLEARNDRATAEGLSAPGVQALIQQAAPFADALAPAESTVADRAGEVLLAAARGEVPVAPQAGPGAAVAAVPAGLYGPQPTVPAPEPPAHDVVAQPSAPAQVAPALAAPALPAAPAPPAAAARPPARPRVARPWAAPALPAAPAPPAAVAAPAIHSFVVEPPPVPMPAPAARAEVIAPPPLAPERPAAADAAEQRLVAAGLSAGLVTDVVGEAVTHGLPFARTPERVAPLVRAALARRIPVMADLGPDRRVIAVVGAAGAGKTALVRRLAAAYAEADHEVVVVALRSPDGGCAAAAELEPLRVSVIAARDADHAFRRLRPLAPLLILLDTPGLAPADASAAAELAPDLRALGCTEVHLALPATVSPAAADELADALAPLGLTHLAVTHADQTTRPGAPVELAVRSRRPLSYVAAADGVQPADPAALADQLLP